MGAVTLEVILSGYKQSQEIGVACHVHKYIEKFLYKKQLNNGAVPLDYYENDKISADKNVFVLDRSYLDYKNQQILGEEEFLYFTGTKLNTIYKDILITNKYKINKYGVPTPLFYKHELDPQSTEVDVRIVTNFDSKEEATYSLSIDEAAIYTNMDNFFNQETGKYRLYFIDEVTPEGKIKSSLLNLINVGEEATWEDLNLETGKVESKTLKYSREEAAGGFNFYMNLGDEYWWKPVETNILKIKNIVGNESNEGWNVSISNGRFSSIIDGKAYNYYISEYNRQYFYPTKPYSYSIQKKLTYVNPNILKSNVRNIVIKNNLDMEIFVFDQNEKMVEILTTEGSKHGEHYSANVKYVYGSIGSYDSRNGLIYINKDVNPEYTYTANLFYKKYSFELKSLNLNPVLKKENRHYSFIIYCIPNTSIWDKSVQYLIVDDSDKIIFCSQEQGLTFPSLVEYNKDKTLNKDSIIDKKYNTGEDSFSQLYSNLNIENKNQYLILGELYLVLGKDKEDNFTFSLKEQGHVFKEYYDVFRKNKNLLQSKYGYHENGQFVARNKVAIVEVPIEILEEYGGDLNEVQVKHNLNLFSSSSLVKIIKYKYPKINAEYTCKKNVVTFKIEWPGPNREVLVYKYSKGKYDLYDTVSILEGQDFYYTDIFAKKDKALRYKFRVKDTVTEVMYPYSNIYKVKIS